MFEQFDALEHAHEMLDDLKAVLLDEQVLHQVFKDHITDVRARFSCKLGAKTVFLYLLKDDFIDAGSSTVSDCMKQVDWTSKDLLELAFLNDFFEVTENGLADLQLDFEASAELVLDVLRASKATENATTDHDAHLCRQGLSLFHRVSGQNDCALFVALRDALNH